MPGEGGHEVLALGGGGDLLEGLCQQDRRRSRPFTEGVLLHTITRRYPPAVVTCDAPDLLLLESAPVPYPRRQGILAARGGGVADEGLLDRDLVGGVMPQS